jgi:hypothetical protein
MKKLLVGLSIIGLLSCSMQVNAMAGNNLPSNQNSWWQLKFVPLVAGTCIAGYHGFHLCKLKKPEKPKKNNEAAIKLQTIQQNLQALNKIRELGISAKDLKKENQVKQEIPKQVALLQDLDESTLAPYFTIQKLNASLAEVFTWPTDYLYRAFSLPDGEGNDHRYSIRYDTNDGLHNAALVADWVEHHEDSQKKRKAECEEEQRKEDAAFPAKEKEYNQKFDNYKKIARKKRFYTAAGLGLAGGGLALLYFGKKNK